MTQHYHPLRKNLLTKEELASLSTLQPLHVVKDTLLSWAIIISTWLLVAKFNNPLIAVLGFFVVGASCYRLYIIGHDGLHRRLFNSKWLNDLWGDIFILSFIGASTAKNRHNHMTHHIHTCEMEDPDRYKYQSNGKETLWKLLKVLLNWKTLRNAVTNVYQTTTSSSSSSKPDSTAEVKLASTISKVLLIVSMNLIVLLFHWFFLGLWSYVFLWLLPIFLCVYLADLFRVFCEHSMLDDTEAADQKMRLVSFVPGLLERAFIAPLNMNFHAEHHLWTAIPYYKLKFAHSLCANKPLYIEHVELRRSYFGHCARFLRYYNA